MSASNGERVSALGGLADDATHFVKVRFDHVAAAARKHTDEFTERTGERLAWATGVVFAVAGAAAGAALVGVWLLATGLAGGLGAVMGRLWLGQLVAGLTLLVATVGTGIVVQSRARNRREFEQARRAAHEAALALDREREARVDSQLLATALGREAVEAGADLLRRHPLASMAALSATGLLAGSLIGNSSHASRKRRSG